MTTDPRRIKFFLAGAAIMLLALIAYMPAYHAGFIWDDDCYVTGNPLLTEPDGLRRIWFSAHHQSQYFPLVYTTLRWEYALWGLKPFGYHFVNVVLHGMNAVLLWAILRRLAAPGAWLAAAIFAVHPVEVESVAWVTELKNTESTLFYFLAILAWMRFTGKDGTNPWRFYAIALVCQALALFSKTTACTLPAALVLVLWVRHEPVNLRRCLQIAPFVLMGIVMGAVSIWWEAHLGSYSEETRLSFTILQRVLIASHALWFYAAKLIWPLNLAFSYPRWQINTHDVFQYAWPIACAALAVLLWSRREKWPRLAVAAVVFFVAALSPLLGFISEYTFVYTFVADHYQYTASAGLIALFAGLTATWFVKWEVPQNARVLLVTILLAALTLLTWGQASAYRNLETLWRDTIAKNHSSWMAHFNLGNILALDERYPEAIEQFQEALKYKPDHIKARRNMGLAHYNMGLRLLGSGRDAEVMEHFQSAVKYNTNSVKAYVSLGAELEKHGHVGEAVSAYSNALRIDPEYAPAHYDLGTTLAKQEKFDDAIAQLREAVRLDPKMQSAWGNLELALAKVGKTDEALDSLRQQVEANPDNLSATYNLAQALASKNRTDEAVEVYKRASALNPKNGSILNNLGKTLFSAGRKDEGIEYVYKALDVDPGNPNVRYNLAMMLAQKGNLEDARKQLIEALRLKPDFVQAQQKLEALEALMATPALPK